MTRWLFPAALVLFSHATAAQGTLRQPAARKQTPVATPLAAATVAPQDTARVPRIRAGSLVQPDTVTVGDRFLFAVTVEVPLDARVTWPTIEDSTSLISQLAPVAVRETAGRASKRETAQYALAAWDTGQLGINLADAVVRYGERTMHVPVAGIVYVRSVLPPDTSLHVPKPAKALFPREVPWWEKWWPAAAVLLALLVLYWIIRRRRKRVVPRVAKPLDVYARAVNDFERLERLALADAGERGRFVALAVEVLRTYLVARAPNASLALTSSELISTVSDDTRVPITRLAPLLGEADAIKFARYPIDITRARAMATEARAVVDDIEHAEQARIAALAAEREAAAKAERNSKNLSEDEARRRSRRGAA